MLAEVIDGIEADLSAFENDVADHVMARIQVTHLGVSSLVSDALRRGVVATVRDAVARLASAAELPRELPAELIRLARLWVQAQRLPIDLGELWVATPEVFWDRFALTAEQQLGDSARCWTVVKVARAALSGYAGRTSELFREECERTLQAGRSKLDDDSRLGAVSRVLAGRWIDAIELGYDVSLEHVAVIASAVEPVQALARQARRRLLCVQTPEGEVWGWLGGDTRIGDDELDALVAWQRSRGGEVAFGEPDAGIAGFSQSHEQALEARAIAQATDHRAVRFADLRLMVALLRDNRLAKGFIERELGELASSGDRMGELRATLRAYLEQGQSVSATAALRRRDRKTIQRQLRSAERLIRHGVRDRSDELLIALRTADILRGAG